MDRLPGHPRRAEGAPGSPLVRRLGAGAEDPGGGPVSTLDSLARSGVPVLEGVVLTRRAHEAFLRESGLLAAARSRAAAGESHRMALALRHAHASTPIGDVMQELITEALIGLGARSVCVISEDGLWQGIGTIPDATDAVRDAWLSTAGLKRLVRATKSGRSPTWPVLMQREANPEHVGWTLAGGEEPAALYDVRPVAVDGPRARGVAELTLEAGAVLPAPARLRWGLEGGTWYVLGVESAQPPEERRPGARRGRPR